MSSKDVEMMDNERGYCSYCEAIREYSEKWDAYFCSKCNLWLEPKCCETPVEDYMYICHFKCWERPDKPL